MKRLLVPLLLVACGQPEPEPLADGDTLGRCAVHTPLRRPFYGDLHVHTALSLDASLQGTQTTPVDAYRFARGAPLGLQPFVDGRPTRSIRLARPLDFAAVTDHAEFLGPVHICTDPTATGYDSRACRQFRDEPDRAFIGMNAQLAAEPDDVRPPVICEAGDCDSAERSAWEELRLAAEAAYDRSEACSFTSFVGYEWSSNPGTFNLHRNVVFADSVVPAQPTGYFDAPTPELLWDALERDCTQAETGCQALTVPHNSNLSGGLMFDPGSAFDADSAARRAAFEPLVEIFQHKGDSECLVDGPLGDEACGFEKLPYNNLAGANLDIAGQAEPLDHVRDALAEGLAVWERTGFNPYSFGIVASTDTHTGTPGAVAEDGFRGGGGAGQSNREPTPGLPDVVAFNPGGLAVLWAEENSRPALFAAMQRREAYGTSGPRLGLRVFAGDVDTALCESEDFAAQGYRDGVPMGGVLPAGGPVRLAVHAWQDPSSAPLQRVQVVKLWLEDGAPRSEVVDIAGDEVGAVDEATCALDGAGVGDLCTVWEDPSPPVGPAAYYVRVLEVPSCRWSQRQCVDAAIDCAEDVPEGFEGCCDADVPRVIQERAWSSPVWVEPG